MIVLYLLLVAFAAAQDTDIDSNDITVNKPDISFELEDLGDYSDGQIYSWLDYIIKLSRAYDDNYKKEESSSSSEEMSSKHVKNSSDPETYIEENLNIVDDYENNILEEPTRRMFSPLELLGSFLSGKKKVLNGINEGVLGGKTILDGIHEITNGLGEFLATT
ncbi:hypothetical protein RR48_07053 [Papilio machaon]|uniref:Uncharacterized protein n=1 Tax=Papilio machaon TaxID=76193 RepID=A0A194R6N2_PAPMA|nr:hypothetical protein RR48_07053 [Papilio machaon]